MKRIALVFPGQGSQYVGMGKNLYENFSEAREVFEEASDALGFDMKKLCFEGNLKELTKTENTQPAMLTASVAAFKVYMKEIGINPIFAAGHSLGEFSALTCSGAIRFSDCVHIVRERGRFMQEAVTSGNSGIMMAITGITSELIEEEARKMAQGSELVYISNYNASQQTVISGLEKSVEKLGVILTGKGARVHPLKVSAPFHCPIMQPTANRLEEVLGQYKYSPLEWSVISNVTALPYKDQSEIISNLKAQTILPVRWKEIMEFLNKQGVELVLEMGPKTVLKGLVNKNISHMTALSYDVIEDIKILKDELNISDTLSQFKHTVVTKAIAIAVCTRNRNWDNEEYQKGVVLPYREIQKMQSVIEEENRMPTMEEMKKALRMLASVLETKKVPVQEQKDKSEELFEVTGTRDLFMNFNISNK